MIKKLLLIDLDDTLIDTSKQKITLFSELNIMTGMTEKNIKQVYESLKINSQLGDGWTTEFSGKLSSISGKDTKMLNDVINKSAGSVRLHKEILNYTKSVKSPKYIITAGDKKYQKSKIEFLKIEEYFNGVLYTGNDKAAYILSLIKGNRLVVDGKYFNRVSIIDDKDHLLKNVERSWIKVIRPDELYL